MKIRLAQINPIVGDIEHNSKLIKNTIKSSEKFDILVFPELALTGYPPQDLLFDNKFIKEVEKSLVDIKKCVKHQAVILGLPAYESNSLMNSAVVMQHGKVVGCHSKVLLPTYDVFDETRYFTSSDKISPIKVFINNKEVSLGIQICEDLWDESYSTKITKTLIDKGAEMIINISASPYRKKILDKRIILCRDKCKDLKYYFIYCNIVGGQDELVFDGRSFILDNRGDIKAFGGSFKEDMVDFDSSHSESLDDPLYHIDESEELFNALSLGLSDYFKKSGFQKAVIGLSGGIDSAITAAIAVDAIGKDNVIGVSMPSSFSSNHSKSDAKILADNLGIRFETIPINELYEKALSNMGSFFKDTPRGLAEENLQARIRGNILMSISNKIGALVLNTGNKTELALGYCTMYGDMCGAIGVISDINKLEVYEVSNWINKNSDKILIPENSINKIPSAELSENQYDPFDYNIVSPIVDYIINDLYDADALIELGYDSDLIGDIFNKIHRSEYKRRQASPGIKVSEKAFGMGRRYPINNQYRYEKCKK